MKKFYFLSCILALGSVMGHAQYYSFIGSDVQKVNATTNQVIGSGKLLMNIMLTEAEVIKKEVRYASDTQILNQNGNPVLVERIMDLYYPHPNIRFEYNGDELAKLPVKVILHSGNGTRLTVANQAMDLARRGYIVLAPTYRSDRSVVNYCIGFENTVYGMVQDVRAVIRLLTKLHEDVQTIPIPTLEAQYGAGFATFAAGLKESRSDIDNIIFTGFSAGGSAGFHTSMRVLQDHFPAYLNSTEPYIVTGALGPADLGQNGDLDDVGVEYALGYPFAIEKVKGTISRTVGIGDLSIVDFSTHPSPVPVCFIHGTCDTAIPYYTSSQEGASNFCDAGVTFPDGSSQTIVSIFGSDPISKAFAEAGGYAELVTFCGGGHTSNQCIADIVTLQSIEFVKRVLLDQYTPGELLETVYRYLPQNYSNQCCNMPNYEYIQKCSCDDDNPFTVIDLPEVFMNPCSLTACTLTDYCNLTTSVSNNSIENTEYLYISHKESKNVLEYYSGRSKHIHIEIFNIQGKLLFSSEVMVHPGVNTIPLSDRLPTSELLIARGGEAAAVKFILWR